MARPRAEMRKKIIWPTIYSNMELCDLEIDRPWILKSWLGTLSCSDDWGRFAWQPRRIAMLVYPANSERQKTYPEDLEHIAKAGLVLRYGENGEYGCFPKFASHNTMTRPTVSEYPDPPGFVPPGPPKTKEREEEGEVEGNHANNVINHAKAVNIHSAIPTTQKPFPFNIQGIEDVESEELDRVRLYWWKHSEDPHWRKKIFTAHDFRGAFATMQKQCEDWIIPSPKPPEKKADSTCKLCKGEGKIREIPPGKKFLVTYECECVQ